MRITIDVDINNIDTIDRHGNVKTNLGFTLCNYYDLETGETDIVTISPVNHRQKINIAILNAMKHGIPLIPLEELPDCLDKEFIFIDTECNRKKINDYAEERYSNIMKSVS